MITFFGLFVQQPLVTTAMLHGCEVAGALVGCTEGIADGIADGFLVGTMKWKWLDTIIKLFYYWFIPTVGVLLEENVGLKVGIFVGIKVGAFDGIKVGAFVGTASVNVPPFNRIKVSTTIKYIS